MLPPDVPARLLAGLMFALAWCVGRLPLGLLRALGSGAGRFAHAANVREAKVTRRNLEIVAPDISAQEREAKVGAILRATGRNALETLRVWTGSRRANLQLVKRVPGGESFDAALASAGGVIIAAPHFGNWELLIEYLASRAPFALVYRVPEKRAGDYFLRWARGGENVRLVPAETNAMRPLWKALKDGGVVGVTPDQQPKFGGGEFAPFFGKMALTLSLIPKLAERSGAPVLFAWAEPVPGGFDIHFEPALPGIDDPDLVKATAVMNRQVEAIAARDLSQYQWTYKRYSRRPPDSGESNPYHPDCY
jgi:KDO2-lipid IV(A) lauroyltransferase